MHVEVRVALNFLVSFLYNKLPRRRVNQFSEELEATLKAKFEGHWYPEQPYKGSAYRCIRGAAPLDPLIFEDAARNSGMSLADIEENLPPELSIWVDPGEVSYRISEKDPIKLLYSQKVQVKTATVESIGEPPVSGLNPDAQCFEPNLLDRFSAATTNTGRIRTPVGSIKSNFLPTANSLCSSGKSGNAVTFTTAAFAATKFGSTKLKSNGGVNKKAQRNSPTDLSHLVKQQQQLPPQRQLQRAPNDCHGSAVRKNGLSLSPNNLMDLPLSHNFRKMNDLSQLDDFQNLLCTNTKSANMWPVIQQQQQKLLKSENCLTMFGDNIGNNPWSWEANESLCKSKNWNESLCNLELAAVDCNETIPMNSITHGPTTLPDFAKNFFVSPEKNLNNEMIAAPATPAFDQENIGCMTILSGIASEKLNSSRYNQSMHGSSFSSLSSPSLSSSNESSSLNLINEFDNLSLNSNSSSSIASTSSNYFIN